MKSMETPELVITLLYGDKPSMSSTKFLKSVTTVSKLMNLTPTTVRKVVAESLGITKSKNNIITSLKAPISKPIETKVNVY